MEESKMRLYEITINNQVFRLSESTLDSIEAVLMAANTESSYNLLEEINSQRVLMNVIGITITAQDHIEGQDE